MTTNDSVKHYLADFERVADTLALEAAPWMTQVRRAALARFAELGLPTTRDEDWKYTSLRSLEEQSFTHGSEHVAGLASEVLNKARIPELDCHELVFVNGRFSADLSRLDNLPGGTRIGNLAELLRQAPDVVEPYLANTADYGFNGFAALNTAFLRDGAYIQLDADTILDRPVHALFVSIRDDDAVVYHPRVVTVLGAGARATIIESHTGLDEPANFANALTEIAVGPNATLEHIRLQRESRKGFHISNTHVRQHRDSHYVSHNINFGGLLVRNDIAVSLTAPGAEVTLNGLFMARERQHIDNHTRIDHLQPHTRSNENYRGVLDGRARGVFNGKVIVHPNAQKIDAHQSNHNLLLTKTAEIDTKPELEIYADDVKCSHGATTGQLDTEALFYLRSRGLDEATARRVLTDAFAEAVLLHLPVEQVREQIKSDIFDTAPANQKPDTSEAA